jgi:16S rRNA (adenine1518-N6/adenine1519-N6)-dimethyltransferase
LNDSSVDPTDRAGVRRLLLEAGLRPSKRLGQHFLVDQEVISALANVVSEAHPERIVEIGSGLGAITEVIVRRASEVIAIEVDRRLAVLLDERLAGNDGLRIRCQDVLTFNFAEELKGRPAYVVGSLPYRITAPILRRIVEHRGLFSGALLITQREVAEKLIASPGKDGSSLGVLVNAYGQIDLVRQIGRRSFFPIPEVDSTMWTLSFLERPRFRADPNTFFGLVRAIYGARRKMIRSVLRHLVPRSEVSEVLREARIQEAVRGETFSFVELDRLACAIEERRHSTAT